MSDPDSLKSRATTLIGFTGLLLSIVLSLVIPGCEFSIVLQQGFVVILYCFIMSLVFDFLVLLNNSPNLDHNKLLNRSIYFFAAGSLMLIALTLEMLPISMYLGFMLLFAILLSVYLTLKNIVNDSKQPPTE